MGSHAAKRSNKSPLIGHANPPLCRLLLQVPPGPVQRHSRAIKAADVAVGADGEIQLAVRAKPDKLPPAGSENVR